MNVRQLRAIRQAGEFESEFDALTEDEQASVLEVLRGLRIAAKLPGDDDIVEILPPVMPIGWNRPVPGTPLWVYYKVSKKDGAVEVRSVYIPRGLSTEAEEALEEELAGPPPHPYLQPVPDPPDPEDPPPAP